MIHSPLLRAISFAAIFATASRLPAAEPDDDEAPAVIGKILNPGSRSPAPVVQPASDEAQQARQRMTLPPGLEIKLWAAEPMLANPVAFNFDERGRIFVAESHRYRTSVLDIRDYMWMLEDELANRNEADWMATLQRRFGPEGLKELSIETEVVRLLEDSKGTGVADRSMVYADGFNSPLDGIASGVLARRGKVWFTNIPSLWMFSGSERAETRTEISRGYGVRFNFTGHDLHGLIFGPDGKIYFSVGDRGASVRTQEGRVLDVADMGAVFRSNPDGSQMELYAWGLRNPQSLIFTENGDLITGDNDCDNGDEERLVHVVEGGDSGWRIGYQFAPLGRAGPWMSERLWQPRHEGQAAYIIPPIVNIEDGPSGITYYPGTGLDPAYGGNIFITHFKGSIVRSGIFTYKVKPKGATYDIDDARPFLSSALPTDVKFGPDGRLYTSDWAEGWPKSKRGRIYAISSPQHANDPILRETQQLIGGDWPGKSAEELARLLGHADMRVRQEAQFTLAERGAAGIPVLARVASTPGPAIAPASSTNPSVRQKPELQTYARLHAIWGLGQLAAAHPDALAPLRPLLRDSDSEVRAQAAKVLGDHRTATDAGGLIAALSDPGSRVRYFAAQGLGKIGRPEAAAPLLALARENNDADHYLRHAVVMGLVGTRNLDALAEGARSNSRAERLAVLLAYRRLGRPEIARFLADADPYLVREAAIAINDEPINEALPALAALIDRPLTDEPVLFRVLNAHFRLGQPANAAALARYAGHAPAPARLRAEALAQLARWPQPPQRDRIVGTYRPLSETSRDRAIAVRALEPIIPSLLAAGTSAVVQAAMLTTLQDLEISGAADTLFAMLREDAQSGETRASALNALDKIKHPRLAEAVSLAGASNSPTLRLAALPIAARLSPEVSAPVLRNLVTRGTTEEQKTAYRALGTLQHPSADPLLADQLRELTAGRIAAEVQLELLTAAGRRSDPAVKNLLAQREAALAASPDPLDPYRFALAGGNRVRGGQIFANQPVMACIRCHRAGADGGDAGPDLADIGARYDRAYLLESIVKPNAKIAPGFDTIVLTLRSGGAAAGIVASEDADTLTLRNTDNKLVTVRKSDIAKREGAPSSMPEIYHTILTRTQLRDVVEFLAGLTEKPTTLDTNKPRALRGPPAPQPVSAD
jgi:quinoprotein glucose dehydrogenase